MQGVEIWNKINESVGAIAWPGVVLVSVILFRTKLGELLERLREAVTPAGTVKFDPSSQEAATRKVEASAGSLVETVQAEIQAASRPVTAEGEAVASPGRPSTDLREIQGEVEDLVRASFAAGFEAAKSYATDSLRLKQAQNPTPDISWDGPVPQVAGYSISAENSFDPKSLTNQRNRLQIERLRLQGLVDRAEGRLAEVMEAINHAGDDKARQTDLLNEYSQVRANFGRRKREVAAVNAQLAEIDRQLGN